MATYFDNYEISLFFDDEDSLIDASTYSFSINDSIHRIFPSLVLELKDRTGMLSEYLSTVEKQKITLNYGLKDNYITCPFVNISDDIPELLGNNNVTGRVEINALHEYYDKQEISGNAFKGRISDIISRKINSYEFLSKNVDSTLNDNVWYQALYNDSDFMTEILLPNAYSSDSNETPFFLFIDSNNNFNFKTYNSLTTQNVTKKLFWLHEDLNNPESNVIWNFKKIKPGSLVNKFARNRNVFKFSKDDGSLLSETDKITSYPRPLENDRYLPLYNDSLITSYIDLEEEKLEIGKQNNIKGQQIYSMKDSLFLERFYFTTHLDTTLLAGKMIKLEVPGITNKDNLEKSQYFSDKYLIEESIHTWNTENNTIGKGYTNLIVSRKYLPKLPSNNYKKVTRLFKT